MGPWRDLDVKRLVVRVTEGDVLGLQVAVEYLKLVDHVLTDHCASQDVLWEDVVVDQHLVVRIVHIVPILGESSRFGVLILSLFGIHERLLVTSHNRLLRLLIHGFLVELVEVQEDLARRLPCEHVADQGIVYVELLGNERTDGLVRHLVLHAVSGHVPHRELH